MHPNGTSQSQSQSNPVDLIAGLRELAHHDPDDRALLYRWERLTLTVRCALWVRRPNLIRLYLLCGERLVREGIGKPVPIYCRMLKTLGKTAADQALPLSWRYACAEHLDLPLARLRTLLQQEDPIVIQELTHLVDTVRQALPHMTALLNRNGKPVPDAE